MILFLFLTIIFLYVFAKNYPQTGYNPLILYGVAIGVYLIFVIETLIIDIPYFVSDELKYYNLVSNTYASYLDRITWYFVNYVLIRFDFLPNIGIKLINIPLLLFLFYQIWNIYKQNNNIFLIILILPYFFFMSIRDMRDIFVLILLVSMVFYLYEKRNLPLFLTFTLLLFFTRNFLVFSFLISVLIIEFGPRLFSFIKDKIFKISYKRIWSFLGIIFLITIVLVVFPDVLHKFISLNKRLIWFLTDFHSKRLESVKGISTGNYFFDYLVGAIRYMLTPIPSSLFLRILKGGIDYGILDDIFRFLNQTTYYFMLIYIVVYFKAVKQSVKEMSKAQKLLLLNLFLFVIYYTLYRFGVGHQRVKIPFQLGIAIVFIQTLRFRYLKNRSITKLFLR